MKLAPQVAQGHEGMVPQHAWPGIAHHGSYACLHVGTIAMHGTKAARRLGLPEGAVRQPSVRIFQQRPARGAQIFVPFFMAAIEAYHGFHGPEFLACAVILVFSHAGFFLFLSFIL